jgi:syntaxin 7
MLQSAFEKLQSKYEKLKSSKMQDLMYEAERQQGALMDHERKADELVHHLRTEAERQRDIASRAESASEKAYALERENAELRETALSYQGKMLRMEQELEDLRAGKVEEMRAGGSGRDDDFGTYELESLTGLRWQKKPRGVHQFTHAATGFTFQLSAREGDDDEPTGADPIRPPKPGQEIAEEVTFVPLNEGSVAGLIPPFLADAMDFDTSDMPVFTYKLLQALHTAATARPAAALALA